MSPISSTVIQDIKAMCKAGNASMAYFYFDFRNAGKQGLQDLVRSLLTQLSAHSTPRCDTLRNLYSAHDEGKNQPGDSDLTECLKDMLALPDQGPTYLIIDALDESLNSPGIPSPREKVLQLVEELVELCLPNLRICVTSRPEIDIRHVLEPLTSRRVSLHDQSGQKEDIVDYVRSVVYSKSEQIMRRWRMEDKELVIRLLSERADGMYVDLFTLVILVQRLNRFRWVFCQLEVLRDCLPPSVRRTLDELPESLDETYERILKEIKKPNRDHARRLLSCLVAAVRPLRVEELAEVLAVDYDDEEGIPRVNPNWRWEDQEQALLTSCSSLIAIVESDDSRVVQFSHFSVKEFLTSARLATSSADVMHYHIAAEPAHMILAQACMSALLRSDHRAEEDDVESSSPLSRYAAEHWVAHAKYGNVSACLQKAMEYLFDLDKPYFAAWQGLYDIDTKCPFGSTLYRFTFEEKPDAHPLYYAALCGFQDLVKHLILKYPLHVNARGGYYVTPLVAALGGEHFQTARILRDNGADPNVEGYWQISALHSAAYYGDLRMVQVLLEFNADVNAREQDGYTPLHYLSIDLNSGPKHSQLHNVSRVLLEHGADVNVRDNYLSTALHIAAVEGRIEVVRVLLEHGADVDARRDDDSTALHLAAGEGTFEVVRVLLEHGASVGAEDKNGETPSQWASRREHSDIVKLLSRHGAM
jgi:ankyrin repeat protein